MKGMRTIAKALVLVVMPACGGCGTVVGMTVPEKWLKERRHNQISKPLDLDTSTKVYIGVRIDYAWIETAPSSKDLLAIFVFCPILAADMVLSGIADTLLLPITKGEKSKVDSENVSSHEVPSR
jgi:uncharacterized protein YceK